MKNLKSLIFDECLKTINSEATSIDDIWEEKPVSPEVFFNEWLPPYLSEPQLEVFNGLFKDGLWNYDYLEYLLFWGEGCIAGDTILKDEETGKEYTVKELTDNKKRIKIKSVIKENGSYKFIIKQTGVPFLKGKTKLYKVKTKSGKEVIVSADHKFYTKKKWQPLRSLKIGDKIAINSTTVLNKDVEKKRRDKISNTMLGVKKTKEHTKHIKEAKNTGRWVKGRTPWNKNIPCSDTVKKKISKTNKIRGVTFSKRYQVGKHMKGHKKDCSCSCCVTMGKGPQHYWHRQKYKNINMRSSWEVKYAEYLDKNNIKWKYEPRFFNLDKLGNYFPDFYLVKENKYIEIKGIGNLDKVIAFRQKYPNETIDVLKKDDLIALGIKL
jgi:intein/homing endonuclease